jgi:hypothetical protein
VAAGVQASGLQDDLVYAKDFVGAKWRSTHCSPLKLKAALRHKGVDGQNCDKAIAWLHEVSSPRPCQPLSTCWSTCRHMGNTWLRYL